ncbi:MAG: uroporphyrinogen-III synthase [Deltaproteobacteria bacterium]|nr:uroporphyrinogen-III synthase [Deltaproteobacteria bacterium]
MSDAATSGAPPAGAPLSGQRILITRPREQAGVFVRGVEALGAHAVVFPTVEILPLADTAALDQAIRGLPERDWLVFTSANGVRHFLARCEALARMDSLKGLSIAAIGPQTARLLEQRGLAVSLVPEEYRAEGILSVLGPERARGRRFLLARVAGARDVLPETLRRWDAEVEVVEAYRNEPVREGAERLPEVLDRVDWVTFTSPSTVNAFMDLLAGANAELPAAVRVACIGPITADAARRHGLDVTAVAREYTISGLLQALVEAAATHVDKRREKTL